MREANLRNVFPKYGGEFTESQKLDLMKFVLGALGEDTFLAMGPMGISKYADALGIKANIRRQKPTVIDFACPHCQQTYSAPEDMANHDIECHKCGKPLLIPRPPRGFYAAPSEAQLEDAEYYGIEVPEGIHRGQLKELISAAMTNPARQPSSEALERYQKRKHERHLRDADPETRRELLKEAADDARYREKERRLEKEQAKEEAELNYDIYDMDFGRDGDWAEFYRKASRMQLQQIFAWLDENKPGWSGASDIAHAIDHLFPELKK
jgi:DNA-directed RNA polymerase subunit RPC12/RpoP